MTVSTARRRVVVTGMGVVAPNGDDIATFWANLTGGVSAVRTIRRFDASSYPSRIAADVESDPLAMYDTIPEHWRIRDRITQFGLGAATRAIADAALLPGPDTSVQPLSLEPLRRTGVLIAAGLGTYGHDEIFGACALGAAHDDQPLDWNAFRAAYNERLLPFAAQRRTPGSLPALVAGHFGFRGPVMSVMTACAAGSQAIGDACRWIRTGRADVVVAGGADSELYPMGLASFCLLGALSTRNNDPQTASRPFDSGRDGFVIGEGSGVLVLEELEHARCRGARILGEIAGFGSACDSYRVTDPHPDGRGAILAMRGALHDGGIEPSSVRYINAHGTSTVANDRIETRAIRSLFGSDGVAVSSTKSMIGHLTVAAGAVEAIATLKTLETGTIHPTINYTESDPDCEIDCVPNVARTADIEYALSNSFAFGGQCASLLMRRFDG